MLGLTLRATKPFSDHATDVKCLAGGIGNKCLTAHRHDLIPVIITDRFERSLPAARALLVTEQLEGGPGYTADLSSPAFRRAYETQAAARRAGLENVLRSAGTDWIDIDPALPVHGPVVKFFRQRRKSFRPL